jgi:hypothetical protein
MPGGGDSQIAPIFGVQEYWGSFYPSSRINPRLSANYSFTKSPLIYTFIKA